MPAAATIVLTASARHRCVQPAMHAQAVSKPRILNQKPLKVDEDTLLQADSDRHKKAVARRPPPLIRL
jgi:hypothetical protein